MYLISVEDDIEVVDACLDGLVSGQGGELVAAEVSCRRSPIFLLQVNLYMTIKFDQPTYGRSAAMCLTKKWGPNYMRRQFLP